MFHGDVYTEGKRELGSMKDCFTRRDICLERVQQNANIIVFVLKLTGSIQKVYYVYILLYHMWVHEYHLKNKKSNTKMYRLGIIWYYKF